MFDIFSPEQQVQNFGEPFFLVIHEGETLADVKMRIQKKLQVPEEEFSKVCYTAAMFFILNFGGREGNHTDYYFLICNDAHFGSVLSETQEQSILIPFQEFT